MQRNRPTCCGDGGKLCVMFHGDGLHGLFGRCFILLFVPESPRKGYGAQKLRARALGYHPFTGAKPKGQNLRCTPEKFK
jgi:hypothetical protein